MTALAEQLWTVIVWCKRCRTQLAADGPLPQSDKAGVEDALRAQLGHCPICSIETEDVASDLFVSWKKA